MTYAKMIEPKQVQLIHIAKAQCCLSKEDYEEIIEAHTKGKKSSSKDLTYFEADGVLNYFVKTLGFKIQSNYIRTSGAARRTRWQPANDRKRVQQNPPNVIRMPSRDQLDMIDILVKKIAWKVEDGYKLWRRKYMKIDRIKTAQQANDTIEGLKGLLDHQIQGA
ncbi:MAG: DUF1018 domain-containing protein [Deltaproteobacteria bacterium]|nr:DUF1018 domain-containing protein [Deltaproteobacteria bacterium]